MSEYTAPTPFGGDELVMAQYTYWLSRAEAWMVEASHADRLSVEYQYMGAYMCAALCARDAVTATRNYQRCLVNAESWL